MNTLTPPYEFFFYRTQLPIYYKVLLRPITNSTHFRECIMQCGVLLFIHYTHAECMYYAHRSGRNCRRSYTGSV